MSAIPPEPEPIMSRSKSALNFICTLVTGAGIGWFLGLSLESLASTVLTAILTLVTGTATVLAGFGIATKHVDGGEPRADPAILMTLVIGLVAGSITSTLLRANLLFGPAAFIAKKTGLSERDVARILFEKANQASTSASSSTGTVLGLGQTNVERVNNLLDCKKLKDLRGQQFYDEIRAELESIRSKKIDDPATKATVEKIEQFANSKDEQSLRNAIKAICQYP